MIWSVSSVRRLSSVTIEFPRKYKYYSIYITFFYLRYKYFLLTTTHSFNPGGAVSLGGGGFFNQFNKLWRFDEG